MPRLTERFASPREALAFNFHLKEIERVPVLQNAKGLFIFDMRDGKTGESLVYWEKPNIIVSDASIQAARYFKDPAEPANGANMLAIGTGALGALLSPNAPDPRQRKLNAEIARKAFSSKVFRTAAGAVVSYPTNIVDYTATYSEAEAVGPLNEMGILSTISANPLIVNPNPNTFPTRDTTLDISNYDVLINYISFPVLSKPATATLSITWRLIF